MKVDATSKVPETLFVIVKALVTLRFAELETVELEAKPTEPVPKAAPALIATVPAFRVVPPVKVLAAPRVNFPAPSLVKDPEVVPKMLFNTVSPAPPTVRPKVPPVIVPALVKESVPLSELIRLTDPKVTNPP